MNAEDIYKETNYVPGPNGQPVILVPAKQKTESDLAPSITTYIYCIACSVSIAVMLGIMGFIFLMIAVFGDAEVFYTVVIWFLGFIVFFSLIAVPCCVKLNKHQNLRVQKFMHRDGDEDIIT